MNDRWSNYIEQCSCAVCFCFFRIENIFFILFMPVFTPTWNIYLPIHRHEHSLRNFVRKTTNNTVNTFFTFSLYTISHRFKYISPWCISPFTGWRSCEKAQGQIHPCKTPFYTRQTAIPKASKNYTYIKPKQRSLLVPLLHVLYYYGRGRLSFSRRSQYLPHSLAICYMLFIATGIVNTSQVCFSIYII